MKKLILLIGFLTFGLSTIQGQEIADHALGLRFSENSGVGAEFTYQKRLSESNRLEIDLGIRGNNGNNIFKATGLYQWVWVLEDNFNWYLGAGGGLGSFNNNDLNISEVFLFGAGVIGVEYNFDIPIIVALDFRPEIGLGNVLDGFNADFGLAVRYQF